MKRITRLEADRLRKQGKGRFIKTTKRNYYLMGQWRK